MQDFLNGLLTVSFIGVILVLLVAFLFWFISTVLAAYIFKAVFRINELYEKINRLEYSLEHVQNVFQIERMKNTITSDKSNDKTP